MSSKNTVFNPCTVHELAIRMHFSEIRNSNGKKYFWNFLVPETKTSFGISGNLRQTSNKFPVYFKFKTFWLHIF